MAGGYQVDDQEGIYFVTSTVHQWADVFTRKLYVDIILDSLRFCQENKGLEIYAWVVISNLLSDIFRRECRTTDLPDLQSGLLHPD